MIEKKQQVNHRKFIRHHYREKDFIFIGGPPRSGTTLVQNMLDSHPHVYGGPEFFHLRDIIYLRTKLRASIEQKRIDFICSFKELDYNIAQFIEQFFLPLKNQNGVKFISEKTPSNVLVFRELMDLFPKAKFIFVVRDPRAVIASLIKVSERAKAKGTPVPAWNANLPAAINYIAQCYKAGFEARKYDPNRLFLIVYEKLVKSPAAEMRKLCDFLNIPWNKVMLYPGDRSHDGETAICDQVWYEKNEYYRNPTPAEIDKWKNRLSPLRQILISRVFNRNEDLISVGYDFSITHHKLRHRLPVLVYLKLMHLSAAGFKIIKKQFRLLIKPLRYLIHSSR